ncbi:MAG: polysaccharide deacetylase family protein [Syntrophomonadaceae bacterium]
MSKRKLILLTVLILAAIVAAGTLYFRQARLSQNAVPPPSEQASLLPAASDNPEPSPVQQAPDPAELAKRPPVYVSIFMYHEVGEGPNNLYLAEKNLYAQMKYLHDNGFQTITMARAREMLANKEDMTGKVVLTFDDGYKSFYNTVWPVLKEFNQTATLYVISDLVGNDRYVTWEQVKILADNGIEIGGHTKTHPLLARIDPDLLDDEISGGKREIEAHIERPITSFCYPTGSYNRQVIAKVKEAGYETATTMESGKASSKDDPFLLPRWGVFKQESLSVFVAHCE